MDVHVGVGVLLLLYVAGIVVSQPLLDPPTDIKIGQSLCWSVSVSVSHCSVVCVVQCLCTMQGADQ